MKGVVAPDDSLAGVAYLDVASRDAVGLLLAVDVAVPFADDLIARDAEQLLAGTIDHDVAEIPGILHDDRRRHVLDDGVEERLCAADLLFRLLDMSDVVDDADEIPGFAVGAADRHSPRRDVAHAASRRDELPFVDRWFVRQKQLIVARGDLIRL